MSESSPAPAKSLVVPGVITVLGVALVARLWILGDAFWLDEIWSLSRVDEAESLLDIVTTESFQHDNNHPLITAWMSIIGDSDHWVLYRIPSLLSGMVAVLLVMDFAKGLRGVLFPGALIGLSFSMILYSTEARGYAMAVCFVVGAYRILARAEGHEFRLSVGGVIGYWSLCILAFLSHLIGVHFFAGMLAWTGIRLLRKVSIGEGALAHAAGARCAGGVLRGTVFAVCPEAHAGGRFECPRGCHGAGRARMGEWHAERFGPRARPRLVSRTLRDLSRVGRSLGAPGDPTAQRRVPPGSFLQPLRTLWFHLVPLPASLIMSADFQDDGLEVLGLGALEGDGMIGPRAAGE